MNHFRLIGNASLLALIQFCINANNLPTTKPVFSWNQPDARLDSWGYTDLVDFLKGPKQVLKDYKNASDPWRSTKEARHFLRNNGLLIDEKAPSWKRSFGFSATADIKGSKEKTTVTITKTKDDFQKRLKIWQENDAFIRSIADVLNNFDGNKENM